MKEIKYSKYKTTGDSLKWFLLKYAELVEAGKKTDIDVPKMMFSIVGGSKHFYKSEVDEMFYKQCEDLVHEGFTTIVHCKDTFYEDTTVENKSVDDCIWF